MGEQPSIAAVGASWDVGTEEARECLAFYQRDQGFFERGLERTMVRLINLVCCRPTPTWGSTASPIDIRPTSDSPSSMLITC